VTPARLVVFSDLSGTLLDAGDGSWEAARPALRQLKLRRVPVVLCTSMTRAAVVPLRAALGLADPFVTEGGGGVYIPRNYFPFALPASRVETDFQVLELGQPYEKLTRALDEAAKTSGVRVRAFNRMTEKELAALTGWPRAEIRLARRREFDEPFLVEKGTPQQKERFERWLEQRGLRLRRGAHFQHLQGGNDKGLAVARLVELYRKLYDRIHAVGLGDSAADADFLALMDSAVLVPWPDGRHDPEARQRLPGARLAPAAGPAGWNAAVQELLQTSA